MDIKKIKTLGELKKSGYKSLPIKEEIRKNLLSRLSKGEETFPGIWGFEDTVIPDLERAILSRHNILLLGLRGQAKTRIARLLIQLLDEHMPIIEGSEINDDPLKPISFQGIQTIKEHGDKTPITWVHRSERYVEKLATPDVSIADLVGDVDPIKAASLKLPFSDERVIHFGLIPRAHRSIFVINELPDLQARIQVSLFNILEEGDLQIRGFKLRMPLDLQFLFTANPEDYTNRGSIVTPLKDRIESQILTHYPRSIEIARKITDQEANIVEGLSKKVNVPDAIKDMIAMIAFEARSSEYIDEKSGVSARMGISAFENLISTAERRMVINKDKSTSTRITDFWGIIPALTGKMELVYEGEQEGPYNVALSIINGVIEDKFLEFLPHPDKMKAGESDPYGTLRQWFAAGNEVQLLNDDSEKGFKSKLDEVVGLKKLADTLKPAKADLYFTMELILHGLSEVDVLNKTIVDGELSFSDPFGNMLDDLTSDNLN